MFSFKDRRAFLKNTGVFFVFMQLLPAWRWKGTDSYVVDFVTSFPEQISLAEYREFKRGVQDQKKINELIDSFKRTGKILETDFQFFGSHSIWTVSFLTKENFDEWMSTTDRLSIHFQREREERGYELKIRPRS
jgi:hypothetical protein